MLKIIILLIQSFFIVACSLHSSVVPGVRPDNESLRQAVEAYWNYRVSGDLYHAYDYEHISFLKTVTRQFYMNKMGKGILLKGFKIVDFDKNARGPKGSSVVKVKITYSVVGLPFPVPKDMKMTIREYWLKEKDGKWYRLLTSLNKVY